MVYYLVGNAYHMAFLSLKPERPHFPGMVQSRAPAPRLSLFPTVSCAQSLPWPRCSLPGWLLFSPAVLGKLPYSRCGQDWFLSAWTLGIVAGPIRGLHPSVWVADGHVTKIPQDAELVFKDSPPLLKKKKIYSALQEYTTKLLGTTFLPDGVFPAAAEPQNKSQ